MLFDKISSIFAALSIAVLAAILCNTPAHAQNDDNFFIAQQMEAAGFTPLAEINFAKRNVRRTLAVDPYMMLATPGVEMERHHDGRLTLRIIYPKWRGPVYPLSQQEWDRLEIMEAATFAPIPKSKAKANPNVVIHCWSGFIESTSGQTATWGCNNASRPAMLYTQAILALAIEKSRCQDPNPDILWRFSTCFTDSKVLEDGVLQEKFAALQARWKKQRDLGPDKLSTARTALHIASETNAPADIAHARDAIFGFGQHQTALRTLLQNSYTLVPLGQKSDQRTRAIMGETFQYWAQDIEAQNGNYIELLEGLTRLFPRTGTSSK